MAIGKPRRGEEELTRTLLIVTLLSLALGSTPRMGTALGLPRPGRHNAFHQRQKKERKRLAEQQRAMKHVMKQHPMSTEQDRRFKHDMKMQRQLLRHDQKTEARALKQQRRPARARGLQGRPATVRRQAQEGDSGSVRVPE